jgi:hypothetical protein
MNKEFKNITDNELKTYLTDYTEQIFEFQEYIDRLSSACDDVSTELENRGYKIKPSYQFIKTSGKI